MAEAPTGPGFYNQQRIPDPSASSAPSSSSSAAAAYQHQLAQQQQFQHQLAYQQQQQNNSNLAHQQQGPSGGVSAPVGGIAGGNLGLWRQLEAQVKNTTTGSGQLPQQQQQAPTQPGPHTVCILLLLFRVFSAVYLVVFAPGELAVVHDSPPSTGLCLSLPLCRSSSAPRLGRRLATYFATLQMMQQQQMSSGAPSSSAHPQSLYPQQQQQQPQMSPVYSSFMSQNQQQQPPHMHQMLANGSTAQSATGGGVVLGAGAPGLAQQQQQALGLPGSAQQQQQQQLQQQLQQQQAANASINGFATRDPRSLTNFFSMNPQAQRGYYGQDVAAQVCNPLHVENSTIKANEYLTLSPIIIHPRSCSLFGLVAIRPLPSFFPPIIQKLEIASFSSS